MKDSKDLLLEYLAWRRRDQALCGRAIVFAAA